MALWGCETPRADGASVEEPDGVVELTAFASSALSSELKANGVDTNELELNLKLEQLPDGGLQLRIVCSSRADHLLRGRISVTGRGSRKRRVVASMVSEAAKGLAADCR